MLPPPRQWLPPVWLAALLAAAFVLLAVPLLDDYGPTWDLVMGEYPYGERLLGYLETGDAGFLDLQANEPAVVVREPHPDFTGQHFADYQVYPLAALLSALSCRLFWGLLGWLPAMSAHHLPIVLLVAAMSWVMVWLVSRRWGSLAGFGSALLLLGAPRFFADAMHNLKDMPTACFYSAAVACGFAALTGRRWIWWVLAGVCCGLALACKANALFAPIQLGLLAVVLLRVPRWRGDQPVSNMLLGAGLALPAFALSYFAVSPGLWRDPIGGFALRMYETLRVGNTSLVGDLAPPAVVSFDGPYQVLITTPLPLLVLGTLGLCSRRLSHPERLCLLLGVLVPIGRTSLPGMRNFDGVRHFLEFMPPLAVAAGIGLSSFAARAMVALRRLGRATTGATCLLVSVLLVPGIVATARTHPNGIAYYNELVGGLPGAQARGISGATDYWGGSYWHGLAWLSEHAPPGAQVLVPLADHVARCAAPLRLRPDLRLLDPNLPFVGEAFVMYVTRADWYSPFVKEMDRRLEVVHEIRTQGAPVLRVVRLPADSDGHELWRRQLEAGAALGAVMTWLDGHPDVRVEFLTLAASWRGSRQELQVQLQAMLPPELHASLADALVWLERQPR